MLRNYLSSNPFAYIDSSENSAISGNIRHVLAVKRCWIRAEIVSLRRGHETKFYDYRVIHFHVSWFILSVIGKDEIRQRICGLHKVINIQPSHSVCVRLFCLHCSIRMWNPAYRTVCHCFLYQISIPLSRFSRELCIKAMRRPLAV